MRVCTLGHSGLLGSAIRFICNSDKDFVDVLGSRTPRRIISHEMTTKEVVETISPLKPDIIINCISNIDIEYCEDNYQTALNVEKQIMLSSITASNSLNCAYVYISSDYVFSGKSKSYPTTAATDPINRYGKIKSICEETVMKNKKAYVVRPTIIYGKNYFTKLPSDFLCQVLGEKRPHNITAIKYPIWSLDLAYAILKTIASQAIPGCYHFTSGAGKNRGTWFDELIGYPRVNYKKKVVKKPTHNGLIKPNNVKLEVSHEYGLLRDISSVFRKNNGNFETR